MNRERSTLGTYVPKYDKAMKLLSFKVPESTLERIKLIPDRSEFLRNAIEKALKEREDATA